MLWPVRLCAFARTVLRFIAVSTLHLTRLLAPGIVTELATQERLDQRADVAQSKLGFCGVHLIQNERSLYSVLLSLFDASADNVIHCSVRGHRASCSKEDVICVV